MKLTVFTPTYNRAYIIEKLYRSLQQQTCTDFEWVIVDDGSSDPTRELVSEWLRQENPFPIRYFRTPNGGKHRAINFGIRHAEGELFFIADSDDQLTPDAVEAVLAVRETLPNDHLFAGVCGCKGQNEAQIIGSTFSGDTLDCTSLERKQYGIEGDKAEVFFTAILRKFPFPEFEGEKFVTEATVWDKIADAGYSLRFFNKIIYLCDYLGDGLTSQGLDLYYRNPQGYGYYLRHSRAYHKFGKQEQLYFDVQCYLHWRKQMRLAEIAALIGISTGRLLCQTVYYQLRQVGSNCKNRLFRLLRENKIK